MLFGTGTPFSGCKQNPAQVGDDFFPGKRDYVWATDTLMYPTSYQTCMRSIYGTSASNVYVVGHNDLNRGFMYRYDGKRWSHIPLTYSEGGPIQKGIDLCAIHGTSANDIWAVGLEAYWDAGNQRLLDSSLVLHFNGQTWGACYLPQKGLALYGVFALSSTEVWAVGAEGTILHWDGFRWSLHRVGKGYFMASVAALSKNDVYAYGHMEDSALPLDSSGSYLFHFDGSKWAIVDSVMNAKGEGSWHMGTVISGASQRLYSTSPNVFVYDGAAWKKILQAPVGRIWQNAPNSIVASGSMVWHYNGEDWKEIYDLGAVRGLGCYTDGNEIFVVGNDNYKSFIRHGK